MPTIVQVEVALGRFAFTEMNQEGPLGCMMPLIVPLQLP